MISFPNAKINIGLNVVSKRVDGYHNIETIFHPVNLADVLELIDSKETGLTTSGIEIDGKAEDNLIIKAYQILKEDYNFTPVKYHLHKVIPLGAGLGGGSSDAAFALKMLNEYFKLKITNNELENYAAKIGADCPFFIKNKPAFATGTGNELQPIELDLSEFQIIILKPNIFVRTPEAYAKIIPSKPKIKLTDAIQLPIEDWKDVIENDFEKSVFIKYPEVGHLKEMLYNLGASYASMSGSGSSVFGIFRHLPIEFENKIPKHIFIYR